jgi:methylmalonyl-CoA mutase N-terminal domain/subunit
LNRIAADAADPAVNLMPALIEAVGNMVTVGEAMHALETVFGTYVERQVA